MANSFVPNTVIAVAGLALLVMLLSMPVPADARKRGSKTRNQHARGGTDIKNAYCGMDDCYELLGVEKTATHREIRRAYRNIAREVHPDKVPASERAQATELFAKIATAYEVVGDEDVRADYDYCLSHPESALYCKYRYMKFMYTSKAIDARYVIGGFVAFLTVCQYFAQHSRHTQAMRYLREGHPDVQKLAKKRATERMMAHGGGGGRKGGKKGKGKQKELMARFMREEVEALVGQYKVEGGYAAPTWRGLLPVRLALLPWSVAMFFWWYVRWYWRFSLRGQPYGPDERAYLTRRALGLAQRKFDCVPEEQRADLIARELWKAGQMKKYRKDMEEEYREKVGEKQYKRMVRQRKKYRPDLGAPED